MTQVPISICKQTQWRGDIASSYFAGSGYNLLGPTVSERRALSLQRKHSSAEALTSASQPPNHLSHSEHTQTVTRRDPGSREPHSSGLQPSPKTCCRRAVPEMRASYFTLRCSVSFPKPLPLWAGEAWINKVARRPICAMWRGVINSSKHCIKWQSPMFPRRFLAIPVKQKFYPVCKAEFLR